MKSEYKGPWVEALRSGDYRQGKWRLKTGDSYCCLGVLKIVSGDTIFLNEDGCSLKSVLDEEDYYRFGLLRSECIPLESMNDGVNSYKDNQQSFNQIADYIEKNL